MASDKGASAWLTALPIQEHGFALHRAAFHDVIVFRYAWLPSCLPVDCACGKSFTCSVEHASSCVKGSFPSLRHNEIRSLSASLVSEVCSYVCTEPVWNTVTNESLPPPTIKTNDAQLDLQLMDFGDPEMKEPFLTCDLCSI